MDNLTVDVISGALKSQSYQKHGNECVYNGHTGRPFTSLIFLGPTFYQRLKHLVDDKIHARGMYIIPYIKRVFRDMAIYLYHNNASYPKLH